MDDIKEPVHAPRIGKKAGVTPDNVVNRQKLLVAVTEKTGLPRSKAMAAMDAVFESVGHSLKEGNEVRVLNFGSFVVSERKAGKGRDPRTGVEINVPESKSVRFRPSKALREILAGGAVAGHSESED